MKERRKELTPPRMSALSYNQNFNPFSFNNPIPLLIGYVEQITLLPKTEEHKLIDKNLEVIGGFMNKLSINDIQGLFVFFNKALIEQLEEVGIFYNKEKALKELEFFHADNLIEEIGGLIDKLDRSAKDDILEFQLYSSAKLLLVNVIKYYEILTTISKVDDSKVDTPDFDKFVIDWATKRTKEDKPIFD